MQELLFITLGILILSTWVFILKKLNDYIDKKWNEEEQKKKECHGKVVLITLDENDIKKIIAEKYQINPYKIGLKYSKDDHGTERLSAYFEYLS